MIKVTEAEMEKLIQELSERMKDVVYMEAENKIKEMLEELLPKLSTKITDDDIRLTFNVDLISGDIIQILGRERRTQGNK